MRVLVGFDGSEGARDAVALTRLFCADGKDAALLVNVLPYGGGEPFPAAYESSEPREQAENKQLFDEALARLHGIEVETRTYAASSPASGLSDIAEKERVDLVAVGSPHRGMLGRALIGSVAEALLHGATIPMVAAPRGYAQVDHSPFRVIGVAYDGSPESRLALAYAQETAARAKAAIRVLSVEEPMAVMPGVVGYTPPPPIDSEELIDEALGELGGEPPADGCRLFGPVASSLAKACEDGVDILVAGSRGHGPAGRILLGSVTTQLVHKAPCPVLVVSRGKRSGEVVRPRTESAIHGG